MFAKKDKIWISCNRKIFIIMDIYFSLVLANKINTNIFAKSTTRKELNIIATMKIFSFVLDASQNISAIFTKSNILNQKKWEMESNKWNLTFKLCIKIKIYKNKNSMRMKKKKNLILNLKKKFNSCCWKRRERKNFIDLKQNKRSCL